MNRTNVGHILDDAREGRTILLFQLSRLNETFLDICVTLPSIEESRVAYSLLQFKPYLRYSILTKMVERHCHDKVSLAWLQTTAPAGLLPSVGETLFMFSLPEGIEVFNQLLNTLRASRNNVFDTMKNVALAAGVSPEVMEKLDVYQFFNRALVAESALIQSGAMQEPVRIRPVEKSKQGGINMSADNMALSNAMRG